jgi:hypothetical protein
VGLSILRIVRHHYRFEPAAVKIVSQTRQINRAGLT